MGDARPVKASPPTRSTIVHVRPDGGGPPEHSLEDGDALCLSGGGYRAMLFHVGSLWRLNEAGRLGTLRMVSSVSGGSITAGVLALAFKDLDFTGVGGSARNFEKLVADPIMEMATRTIDWPAVVLGLLGRLVGFGGPSSRVSGQYRSHLFHDATLQDLPDPPRGPRFVINATSLQTGELWRLRRDYAWDYRVGEWRDPHMKIADAVAASSAFPPFLSPFVLTLPARAIAPGTGSGSPDISHPPYTTRIVMTDGGVYDNLGLEAPWERFKCILVSDAGGQMGMARRPHGDWLLQTKRVLDVADNQVRDLRKQQVISALADHQRAGAYWGIRSYITSYPRKDTLEAPIERTTELASISTRLKGLSRDLQERLVNWGYAVCDAAIRSWVWTDLPKPAGFPYTGGV